MAYDNKNAYPSPKSWKDIPRWPIPKRSGGGSFDDTDSKDRLKDIALEKLQVWIKAQKQLSSDRASRLSYYMGEKLGNEIAGRSQVIMTEVADTVESVMPTLMDIFMGGRNVVELRPIGPEDEDKAKLLQEKINWDFQQELNGFIILHNFIKDALILGIGVCKVYWKREEKFKEANFEGLSSEAMQSLMFDPKYVIDEISAVVLNEKGEEKTTQDPVEFGQASTYNVKASEVEYVSGPQVDNVPPEEFLFDPQARELRECAHRKRIHKNELKAKYGISESEVSEEVSYFQDNALKNARFADLGGSGFVCDGKDSPWVFIYEVFIDDFDENGKPKSKKAVIFGNRVVDLQDNTYGEPPFVTLSPILMSNRVIGRSLAELAMEFQKLKTALVRTALDLVYFQSSSALVVNPYRIDVDSLKSGNRPGGLAFTKYDVEPGSAVFPMPVKQFPPGLIQMLEFADKASQSRTGISEYFQGLDSKALNRTATGISIISNYAAARVKLIARTLAETGIKELFRRLVWLNVEYFDASVNIKINKEWATINPEDIQGRYDVMVDTAIGTGTAEIKVQQKLQMLQIYGQIAGMLGPQTMAIFGIEQIKNMIRSIWEDWGYRAVDLFVAPDQPMEVMGGGQVPGAGGPGGPQPAGVGGGQPMLQGNGGAPQPPGMGVQNMGGIPAPM